MKLIMAAIASGVLLSLGASGARADGMPRYGYKYAPITDCCQANWDGFYVAAGVGLGFAETEFDQHLATDGVSARNKLDIGSSDVTGTIAIGYDREIGDGIVLGAFGDYTFGQIESDFTLRSPVGFFNPGSGQNVGLEYDDTWAVGARIGLARSCCTLWYLTAGYTNTQVKFDLRFGGCTPCRDKIDVDSEIHAVRLGISYKFGLHREAEPAPLK